MKCLRTLILLIGLLGGVAVQSAFALSGEFMTKPTKVKFEAATLDEQIVALGRAGAVNVVADATHFPEQAPTVTGEGEDIWGHLLYDLSKTRRLSLLQTDPNAVLLWQEPEFLPLAQKIMTQGGVLRVTPVPTDEELKELLTNYFKQAYGWDGISRGFSKELRLAELPPEIGRPLIARVQDYMMRDTMSYLRAAWFDDGIWSAARLVRYMDRRVNREAVSVKLSVKGQGWSQIGIGWTGGGKAAANVNNIANTATTRPSTGNSDARPVASEPVAEPGEAAPVKPEPVQPEPVQLANEMGWGQLQQEAALRAQVSFEIKRVSLADLLTLAQAQTGVNFKAAADSPAGAVRLTAYVKEMPLAQLMRLISRLYGVRWNKEANGYTMHGTDLPEVDRALLAVGEFREIQGTNTSRLFRVHAAIPDEVIAHVPPAQWTKDKYGLPSFPFTSLSEDLQTKIRRAMEERAAVLLVGYALAVSKSTVENYFLQLGDIKGYIGEKPEGWTQPPGDPAAIVYTAESNIELPVGARKKMRG